VPAFVRGCEPEPFRDLQGPEGPFRALLGRHHVSHRRCETVAPQEFPRTCPLNRPRRCAGSNLPPSARKFKHLCIEFCLWPPFGRFVMRNTNPPPPHDQSANRPGRVARNAQSGMEH
jgi:hypothetical protein